MVDDAKNNSHPNTPPFEYNYIDDGIYVGTNQCCQTHFDEGLMTKEGISADISLEEARVDQPFGVDFYLWLPTKDSNPPNPDQLELGVTALEKLVAMGRKVYVHCKNGRGRAPTLVAAYLIRSKGMTAREAETFMKERRSTIHLEESQREALGSLSN
jgi:protein-tyrosine phosphatase